MRQLPLPPENLAIVMIWVSVLGLFGLMIAILVELGLMALKALGHPVD